MNILLDAVKKNSDFQKKQKKIKYVDPIILKTVENFIVKYNLICYGGTAINNILPKNEQFYDYDVDIPDYDFFSPNALEHAKELCNIFSAMNVYHVESKSAFFVGTYKVFVNFIPIADITQIDERYYSHLLSQVIRVDEIPYTPPDYLRMSMHQELSRPLGDVSRWEKVYKRMKLLNHHFPVHKTVKVNKSHTITSLSEQSNQIPLNLTSHCKDIISIIIKEKGVLCTPCCINHLYEKYSENFPNNIIFPNENNVSLKNKLSWKKMIQKPFLFLHPQANLLCDTLKKRFDAIQQKQKEPLSITLTFEKVPTVYKFVGDRIDVFVNSVYVGCVFQLDSCMSHNIVAGPDKVNVLIGNIDTLLFLYFALLQINSLNISLHEVKRTILDLYEIIHHYDLLFETSTDSSVAMSDQDILKISTKHPLLGRFNLPCSGEQDDYESILRRRHQKFRDLKDKKQSNEYQKWFFKYTPTLKYVSSKKHLAEKSTSRKRTSKTKTQLIEKTKKPKNTHRSNSHKLKVIKLKNIRNKTKKML
jgi:hypothetical protein